MLQTKTVPQNTLRILKKIQADPKMEAFHLVGGTALALYLGHRTSMDIDLFTTEAFDAELLNSKLQKTVQFQDAIQTENTLKGVADGVKVDLLRHPYPWIKPTVNENGVSLVSREDIIAMKLNAITISGQRAKDFIDIYFLLNDFSLSQMLGFYKEKYRQKNVFHVIKSLTYFDEIDASAWPKMILEPKLTLANIKRRILKAVEREA